MFISICIPTYNSGEKLEKLLDSIKSQTFSDYEIVISDDSSNAGVREMVSGKYADMHIRYFHNSPALGTPENWNNAVAQARGEWIKVMHHDDWLLTDTALETFAKHTDANHSAKLIFSAFNNINTDTGEVTPGRCSALDIALLKRNYLNLYKNFIGNPSCTLVSSKLKPYSFDRRIKWLIDMDFYTWYFRKEKGFVYIDKPLIGFRLHSEQVTAVSLGNPKVEIPESFLLFEKYGIGIMRNIFVYDFFWRMYRNLGVQSVAEIEGFLGYTNPYRTIQRMIEWQQKLKPSYLKIGVVSKMMMLLGYLRNRL